MGGAGGEEKECRGRKRVRRFPKGVFVGKESRTLNSGEKKRRGNTTFQGESVESVGLRFTMGLYWATLASRGEGTELCGKGEKEHFGLGGAFGEGAYRRHGKREERRGLNFLLDGGGGKGREGKTVEILRKRN